MGCAAGMKMDPRQETGSCGTSRYKARVGQGGVGLTGSCADLKVEGCAHLAHQSGPGDT